MSPKRSPDAWWGWILVSLLTVFALAPLTYPGFFQAHSGFLPAFNAAHPAVAPNWGRPADPIRGEGKLPYLLSVGQAANLPYKAIKGGYGLAFLLGALGVYTWTRRWLGARGGVLAAVVYTYLPWRLGTVYVRGAYAEAWLWAFWPFLFWAVDCLAERRFLAAGLVGLLATAAIFWTQPGLAALSLLPLSAYAVIRLAGRRRLAGLAVTLPVTCAGLWLVGRAAPEARIPFADHFLYPFQLFSAAWGEGLSFQLGLAAVGLSVVAAALLPRGGTEIRRLLRFWLIVLIVIVLFTLPLSAIVWRGTGLQGLLTYPWQLLALTGLPLAFLAGAVARLDERLAMLPAWAGLAALVILASYPYLAPRFTQVDPGPEPVALFQPVGADAPQIILLGYETAPPTEITPTLTLTLTWQAVEPVADDYTVFVHVLDASGAKIAQRDSRPCDGECPMTAWRPGEIIVDRRQLALPPDTAADAPHRLALGLYLLETGQRAAVIGRDDNRVMLDVK